MRRNSIKLKFKMIKLNSECNSCYIHNIFFSQIEPVFEYNFYLYFMLYLCDSLCEINFESKK
jgi:hypothetical protein